MKRAFFLGVIAIALAGCGGTPRGRVDAPAVRNTQIAYGPISKACMASGREGSSEQLCGCIQSAANQTLTHWQQSRAAAFYDNPGLAQQIRTSDGPTDVTFWDAYAAYGKKAEKQCG